MSRISFAFVVALVVLAARAAPLAAQDTPPPATPTAGGTRPAAATPTAATPPPPKDLAGLTVMRLRQTKTLGDTEIAELDILIEASGQFDKRRRLMRYIKRTGGLERSLLRFEGPPQFRWLAALTIEVKSGADDQWLYLPDIRKVKRVSRAESTESFAGTGFAIEDLRSEDLEAHTYRTLRKVPLQGREAYEIEALPVEDHIRAMAGYKKRHIFVDAERYVEMKVDFYDEDGALLKTQENSDWRKVKDIYRPYRVLMREHQRKRVTWIQFRSWKVNEPIDDDLFTTRELTREDR
jgi:outer membrane lipoprotein-sorting protein